MDFSRERGRIVLGSRNCNVTQYLSWALLTLTALWAGFGMQKSCFLWISESCTQLWGRILVSFHYDVKFAHFTSASMLFQERHPILFLALGSKMVASWRFRAFCSQRATGCPRSLLWTPLLCLLLFPFPPCTVIQTGDWNALITTTKCALIPGCSHLPGGFTRSNLFMVFGYGVMISWRC